MFRRMVWLGGLALVVLMEVPARAQTDPCVSAPELLSAGLINDAVDQFGAAARAGLACGGGPEASAALAAQREAQARFREGQAAQARGDRTAAVERYRGALELNRQHAEALAALRQLAGMAPAPTNPFAGAESLAALGRHDAATEAALKVITDTGATPAPGSTVHTLVERSRWERAATWIGEHWAWLAAGLAAFVLLWSRLKATAWARRGSGWPLIRAVWPRLRLAIDVTDETGSERSIAGAFAARLREDLLNQEVRVAGDPRFIIGSDATFELPDLTEAPSQVTWITSVWRWLMKQNIIVLRVILLPPEPEPGGISCQAALVESNGRAAVRAGRGRSAVDRLHLRVQVVPEDWKYDASAAVPPYQWRYLVPPLSAWALFATRKVQATERRLKGDLGTSSAVAYGELLSGLERLHEPARARPFFQRALDADPQFLEARLNLANCEAAVGRLDDAERNLMFVLAEAEKDLTGAPAWAEPGIDARHRSLAARARYALLPLRLNRLTPTLTRTNNVDLVTGQLAAAEKIETLATELSRQIDAMVERPDALLKLAEALRDHVELMRAGATDLVCKFRAFLATPGSFPSLPLVVDANTRQATLDGARDPIPDCRRKAVATLARYSTTPNTPAVAHYSLACIWARDYRIGAASDEAVLTRSSCT